MNALRAVLCLLVLAGCGGQSFHEYRFLCRTQVEEPKGEGADYDVVACVTDAACIEAAEKSGLAEQMRAEGYALGCPKPSAREVQP